MVGNKVILNDSWQLLADDEDYMLQVVGNGTIMVKASDTVPTDADGAFYLDNKDILTSTILSGKIYGKAGYSKSGAVVQISIAK